MPLQKLMYFAGPRTGFSMLVSLASQFAETDQHCGFWSLNLVARSHLATPSLRLEDGCFCFGRGADFAGILWRSTVELVAVGMERIVPKLREVIDSYLKEPSLL